MAMPSVNTDGCDVLIWREGNDIMWSVLAKPDVTYCAPNGNLEDVLLSFDEDTAIGIVLDNGEVGKIIPQHTLQ